MEPTDKKDKNDSLIPQTVEHSTTQLNEKAWEIAKKRQSVLEPLLSLPDIPKSKVKEVCHELKICRSSLFRLIKKYKDTNGSIISRPTDFFWWRWEISS